MKIPFTIGQFLQVFRQYNETIWPFQIALYLLALLTVFLSFKRVNYSQKIISSFLSFTWIWMGVVYHFIYFSSINKTAYVFGAAFILQGVLFFNYLFLQKKISFHVQPNIYGVTGLLLVTFSILVYPVTGYLLGHRYPSSPTFGLPCPTTIFTFGILLWANQKIPVYLLIIPTVWSVIGFTAAIKLGMIEDIGLLIAGLAFVVLTMLKINQHGTRRLSTPSYSYKSGRYDD